MNWEKRYDGFKTGDKVRITGLHFSDVYQLGSMYTLKTNYIKDGVWVKFNRGNSSEKNENWWDTYEHSGNGINQNSFERVTDK